MPRRRKNSKKVQGAGDDYGHPYRALHVTNDTFKGVPKMKAYAYSARWFEPAWCHEGKNGKGKGALLKSKPLEEMIKSKCKSQMKKFRKNMKKFVEDYDNATPQQQYKWLCNCSIGFHPSEEEVNKWQEIGFGLVTLFSLIFKRQPGVRAQLKLSIGTWTNIVSIHDEILRGELYFQLNDDSDLESDLNSEESSDDEQYESDNSTTDNKINKNKNKKKKKKKKKVKKKKKRKQISDDSDKENDCDNKKRIKLSKKNKTNTNYWVTSSTERQEFETSSNFKRKLRHDREHPFFKRAGEPGQFLVVSFYPQAAEFVEFKSSSGNRHTHDEESQHFQYDKLLVKGLMLQDHKLKKLHKRIISQHDGTQNVFTNKVIPGFSELRCKGSTEFQVAVTVGEMLEIFGRIIEEENVYEINKQLIENDDFKDDYLLGQWNSPYEKKNRIPRSKSHIDKLKEQGKYTPPGSEFWLRVNIFKKKTQMTNKQWEEWKGQLSKWGVLDYMLPYVTLFFPGREAEAQQIGLIPPNIQINEDVDIIGEQKDDEQKDDKDTLQGFL